MRPYADAFAAVWTALASAVGTDGPTEQAIAALRDPAMHEQWPLATGECGPVGQHTIQGLSALAESTETLQAIDDDHFRLIRGPGLPEAIPWESVHRSEKQLLFEEETMEVRRAYQRFGLQAPKMHVEPDDHISLELEFLAKLLAQGMDAEDRGDAEAEEYFAAHDAFCREHLLLWAPTFFTRLTDAAQTLFYRGIGLLGQDAMEQARELVAIQ